MTSAHNIQPDTVASPTGSAPEKLLQPAPAEARKFKEVGSAREETGTLFEALFGGRFKAQDSRPADKSLELKKHAPPHRAQAVVDDH